MLNSCLEKTSIEAVDCIYSTVDVAGDSGLARKALVNPCGVLSLPNNRAAVTVPSNGESVGEAGGTIHLNPALAESSVESGEGRAKGWEAWGVSPVRRVTSSVKSNEDPKSVISREPVWVTMKQGRAEDVRVKDGSVDGGVPFVMLDQLLDGKDDVVFGGAEVEGDALGTRGEESPVLVLSSIERSKSGEGEVACHAQSDVDDSEYEGVASGPSCVFVAKADDEEPDESRLIGVMDVGVVSADVDVSKDSVLEAGDVMNPVVDITGVDVTVEDSSMIAVVDVEDVEDKVAYGVPSERVALSDCVESSLVAAEESESEAVVVLSLIHI